MPIYQYRCDRCKTETEVVRSLADSDGVPDFEEVPTEADAQCAAGHEWVKQLSAVKTIKGPNWGGGKGAWILLVCLLTSLYGCQEPCKYKVVIQVGGCGTGGYCGVQWSDGSYGGTYNPVVGGTYPTKPFCRIPNERRDD